MGQSNIFRGEQQYLNKAQVDAGKPNGKVGNEEDGDVGNDDMLVDESCVDEGLEEEVEADEHIKKKWKRRKNLIH